ncbi:MAG TPA: hypothetical protein VIE89_35345, partial [Candidatus Binatia bacterium]
MDSSIPKFQEFKLLVGQLEQSFIQKAARMSCRRPELLLTLGSEIFIAFSLSSASATAPLVFAYSR